MKSFCFIKKQGNFYLYSLRHKNVISLSKELYYTILYHENAYSNVTLNQYLKNKLGMISIDKINYYIIKYQLLRANQYFEPFPIIQFDTSVSQEDIFENFKQSGIIIILENTFSCNLSCSYCCYGKYYTLPKRKKKYMDFKTAITAIDYIIAANKTQRRSYYINFYGGEALLNFPLIKKIVIHYTALEPKLNVQFKFKITTNGVLLDKYINFLVKHNFDIGLSLDGDKNNNSFRIFSNHNESYSKIFANITKIRQKYSDFFQKNVKFQTVVHSKNRTSNLQHFFLNEFGKKTEIIPLMHKYLNPSLQDEFYQKIEKMDVEKISPKLEFLTIHIYNKPFCLHKANKKKIRPSSTCLLAEKKIFVTTEGEILPCEYIGSGYNFAKCNHDKFNIDFNAIAKMYTKCYKKISKDCSSCYSNEDCTQCMFDAGISKKDFNKCPNYLGYINVKKIVYDSLILL